MPELDEQLPRDITDLAATALLADPGAVSHFQWMLQEIYRRDEEFLTDDYLGQQICAWVGHGLRNVRDRPTTNPQALLWGAFTRAIDWTRVGHLVLEHLRRQPLGPGPGGAAIHADTQRQEA